MFEQIMPISAWSLLLAGVLSPVAASPLNAVDVELSHVQVRCAKANDAGETTIRFRLRSKEPGWVFSETPGVSAATGAGKEKQPFRMLYSKDDEASLCLDFKADGPPAGHRIILDNTLYLTRSKVGRILPTRTFEAEKEGRFLMGGIPFHYTFTPGEMQMQKNSMTLILGHLSITYPENVHLCSLAVTDEKGQGLQERHRSPGKASFTVLPQELGGGKFTVQATLSDAEEELVLPFRKELMLDGVVGESQQREGKPIPEVIATQRTRALDPLASSAATCDAEVGLNRVNYTERDENERPHLELEFEVGTSEGRPLFLKGPDQKVTARDAEGNALTGFYFGSYTDEQKNHPLEVGVSFFDRMPAGGWVELDSGLRLYRAKGMRMLAPQPLSPEGKGTIAVEGLRIDYGPGAPFWPQKIVEPGTELHALVLTFPDDGHIVEIGVCDRNGRPIIVPFAIYARDDKNVKCTYTYLTDAGEQGVQLVVTVWEGVEPCVIPLKMKIGLKGTLEKVEEASGAARCEP